MALDYLLLKKIHLHCVGLSVALFALRLGLRLAAPERLAAWKVLRVLPHGVDTLLLSTAIAMVVVGGIGHIPGVFVGAVLLDALPEVLRYVAGPLQAMTDGRLDSAILRQLLIALAMIVIMLLRPRGLWPAPEHGKSLTQKT